MNEDTRFIEQTLAGDADAFEKLVRRYQDRLFNTLVYINGSPEESEDVVQDTFLQAYTKLSSFQHRASFYTWLYRIAFNVNASRRRRRRPEVSVEATREMVGSEPADGSDSPIEHLERQERVALVKQALRSLGEEQRTILTLREIEDCDYQAIAEILSVPVGTVRSRLHRARLQLKRQLEAVLKEQA